MTSDVRFRDVVEADFPVLFEHQRDPDGVRMAAFPSRDTDAFVAHWTKILGDETVTAKAIVVDGQVAGHVGSWGPPGERNIGYWIGKEYWGRGLATRAVSELLRIDETRPLYAHVAKHNVGSLRVLEKCGFAISGEATVASVVRGGDIEEFILVLGA